MKIFFLCVKICLIVLCVGIVLFGGLLGYLTLVEYRPKPAQAAKISGKTERKPRIGDALKIVSWNVGYACLGADADFFMDGGKTVRPSSASLVEKNLAGIRAFIDQSGADIVLLQEVDTRSRRSYYIDETAFIAENWQGETAFAPNFLARFVPYPIPPIGRVESGLFTLKAFGAETSERIALPSPFKWPVRTANLKRCLLVERIPVADSEKELVLVNLHLEAYTSGAGRDAQMKILIDFLKNEYEKDNYCIAGGDFNQNFPNIDRELFELKDKERFLPGNLTQDMLPQGWRYAADAEIPSSRLLNEPYSGAWKTTQLYAIDGYILSPNTETISVKAVDNGFLYSDHHPIVLEVILK
jgi:endonuclease/exonuclease/phosphatase family metal-dependent hydrolase